MKEPASSPISSPPRTLMLWVRSPCSTMRAVASLRVPSGATSLRCKDSVSTTASTRQPAIPPPKASARCRSSTATFIRWASTHERSALCASPTLHSTAAAARVNWGPSSPARFHCCCAFACAYWRPTETAAAIDCDSSSGWIELGSRGASTWSFAWNCFSKRSTARRSETVPPAAEEASTMRASRARRRRSDSSSEVWNASPSDPLISRAMRAMVAYPIAPRAITMPMTIAK